MAAALLYLGLAVIMFAQGLAPGRTLSSSDYLWTAAPWQTQGPPGVRPYGANGEDADAVAVFQPFTQFAAASLPTPPLWNPDIGIGRPFIGDAQSAVLSPFSLPAYVLPFWRSLAVSAVLKVVLAAFGTFLLARALAMRFGGALLAGLVFGFGLEMIVWTPWPLTNVWAFIPWLLLGADAVARRPGPLAGAGLALVTGLQFLGGHPESSFHALVLTVLFFILRLATAPGGRRRVGRASGVLVLGLLTGAALAAAALLPFVELLARSDDVSGRGGHSIHILTKYVGMLFLPDYWGRPTGTALEPYLTARALYAGALTLMLAVGALVLRPTRERIAVAGFGVLCLAVVLGIPPVFGVVSALPVFAVIHNERLIIMVLLVLALLAGWGLDDLSASSRISRRGVLVGLAAAGILLVPVAWEGIAGTLYGPLGRALSIAWGFDTPPSNAAAFAVVPLSALLEWLPLAGVGLLLVALRLRGRLAPRPFVILAVALVAIDLFRAGMGQNPAIPLSHARQPATPAIRYLQAQGTARFVGIEPRRLISPLPADVAMRYHLFDARSYDYPVEQRYDRLWRRYVAPPVPFIPPTSLASTTPVALHVLGLLGVKSLLQQPIDPPLHTASLALVYRGRDARVYANADALPRVFLVDRQLVVPSDAASLSAVGDLRLHLGQVAVTERRVPGLPVLAAGGGGRSTGSSGSASLIGYAAARVSIAATTTRPSLLVLSDLSYPGWHASVDGRPAPLERVDLLLRGVPLPPGRHRVEMSYAPASWRAGWIVSVLAAVALSAATLFGLRRGRAR